MAYDRGGVSSDEARRPVGSPYGTASQRDLDDVPIIEARERRQYWALIAEQLGAVRAGLTDRVDFDAVRREATRRARAESGPDEESDWK
ncbi:MAG TPA: hypothetical protein VFG59_04370 [Anaeromyxobacter sp.]|nr:hypothetical protein [Anaeromyxobacter sp.]